MEAIIIGDYDPSIHSMTDGIVRADNNFPLDVATTLAEGDLFWANRGKAINSYASLEQALCTLFSQVGEMKSDVAGVIFFKITNTMARNSIIEKLIGKKHGTTYNLFWNAYLRELRTIDLKRNEIVHWVAVTNVAVDSKSVLHVGVSLAPPNFWGQTATSPRIVSSDLLAFSKKCSDFARLASMFYLATNGSMMDSADAAPWLDIFQQPLIYPLPADHLLNRPSGAPDIQPPPSLA